MNVSFCIVLMSISDTHHDFVVKALHALSIMLLVCLSIIWISCLARMTLYLLLQNLPRQMRDLGNPSIACASFAPLGMLLSYNLLTIVDVTNSLVVVPAQIGKAFGCLSMHGASHKRNSTQS